MNAPDPTPRVDPGRRVRAREELDALVVNTELTLISIIQGCALYWIINSAFVHFTADGMQYWPHIAAGLVIILLFWSRALLHTFTLIRWPLEFGHNFLYVVCTFCESVMFTQLADPLRWHLWGAIFWGLATFLFAFDMRMIHERMEEESGPDSTELYRILEKEQAINIKFVLPGATIFHAAAWAALAQWPEFFLAGKGHVILGFVQLLGLAAYQAYVLGFFAKIAPLVLAHRQEE